MGEKVEGVGESKFFEDDGDGGASGGGFGGGEGDGAGFFVEDVHCTVGLP